MCPSHLLFWLDFNFEIFWVRGIPSSKFWMRERETKGVGKEERDALYPITAPQHGIRSGYKVHKVVVVFTSIGNRSKLGRHDAGHERQYDTTVPRFP